MLTDQSGNHKLLDDDRTHSLLKLANLANNSVEDNKAATASKLYSATKCGACEPLPCLSGVKNLQRRPGSAQRVRPFSHS